MDILHLNLHKTFSTPHGGGGPGSGPVGVKDFLKEFLPIPYISVKRQEPNNKQAANDEQSYYYELKNEREYSIGRISSFYGNFAVILRAYSYLLSLGRQNISKISELAILNANYMKKKLKDTFIESDPFPEELCMHECVLNDNVFQSEGISTLDFAKSIIDYGFHPPTIYFPKNIHGAIMIEPTETESIKTMDNFIDAMKEIKKKGNKYSSKSPKNTKTGRVNEVLANKNPIFK